MGETERKENECQDIVLGEFMVRYGEFSASRLIMAGSTFS